MEWYRELYLSEGLEKKRDRLIKKIESNAGVPGVYLVTLASNGRDLFDIFSANALLQPVLHGHCPMIVGVCKSHEEAVELSAGIALAAYEKTGSFDVASYLKSRITDGEAVAYRYPSERLRRRKRRFFGK